MSNKLYSQAIIDGLRRMGVSTQQMCAMTHTTAKKIKAISEGKSSLTEKQLDLIELATGRGTGQIVALTVDDKETAKLLNELGEFEADCIMTKRPRAMKSA